MNKLTTSALDALPSLYILIPTLFICYKVVASAIGLYKNLRDAQKSGIPYLIAPWYIYNRFSLTTEPIWLSVAKKLPSFLTQPWLRVMRTDWAWHERYSPFRDLGSDTFIVVSHDRNVMYTCDADVINQLTTRRNDFPKPVEVYGILDVFGGNVVTAEGADWRRHRKITAAQFNEKSNEVVWRESLFQAQEMVRCWREGLSGGDKLENEESGAGKVIYELARDTMKLSLHVISRAGFGVRCLWPSAKGTKEADLPPGSISPDTIPEGHTMSYVQSLELLLHRIIAVLLLPEWLLRRSQIKVLQDTGTAFREWGQYMREIYDRSCAKIETMSQNQEEDAGLDLMGAMVKASSAETKAGAGLTPTEILGNSFVMFLAGHETAANSLFFAALFLALRPSVQRKLQEDLDSIFGSTPVEKWDYDSHLPKLFAGWAGAVMNEELRLVPPVINIPKSVSKALPPQTIKANGKDCVLEPGTFINLNTVCTHRNPKYWPAGPGREGAPVHQRNLEDDLEEFKPERWFVNDESEAKAAEKIVEARDEDTGADLSPDTAASMFRPRKGAYIPFSEGPRSCVGRRFAQVEILAVLAVIFKKYSIELFIEDQAIEKMSAEERRSSWEEEVVNIERRIREDLSTIITIQMRGKPVKLRVCERGEELYDY